MQLLTEPTTSGFTVSREGPNTALIAENSIGSPAAVPVPYGGLVTKPDTDGYLKAHVCFHILDFGWIKIDFLIELIHVL